MRALRPHVLVVANSLDQQPATDRQRGIPFAVAVVQDETALRVHRATGQHHLRLQRIAVAGDAHLLQHLAEGVFRGSVDHHAHGAVAVVLADERHAAGEPLPFDVVRNASEGMGEVFFSLATALNGEAENGFTLLYTRATRAPEGTQ